MKLDDEKPYFPVRANGIDFATYRKANDKYFNKLLTLWDDGWYSYKSESGII
jgi:hypothetical protein